MKYLIPIALALFALRVFRSSKQSDQLDPPKTEPKRKFASALVSITRKTNNAERTRKFWSALGYEAHEEIPGGVAVLLSDNAVVVFLSSERRKEFYMGQGTESDYDSAEGRLLSLMVDNKEQVNKMHSAALANGGEGFPDSSGPRIIESAYGLGYGCVIVDPDGYGWMIACPK